MPETVSGWESLDACLTVPALRHGEDLPGPVLGIDTSAGAAVALLRKGEAASRRWSGNARLQVEELAPLIADVLDEAILAPGDLAAVVVGVGPAPYTGLRIGLATGRALGLALGIPVWGVGSLEALAADAVARLSPPPGTRLLAAADARRREIYWAAYRVGPEGEAVPEGGPAVGPAASAPAADVVVGGAVSVYPDVLPTMPAAPLRVDPAVLAGLGVARAAMGAVQPMAPIYLRRPDVAPPSPRKRVTR